MQAVRRWVRRRRERLARYGLKVDLMPAEYRAEAIAQPSRDVGDVQGLTVLLPRADIGREIIGDELRRQGAEVTEVIAYRTVVVDPEREGEPDVYRMLLDNAARRRDVRQRLVGAELRARVRPRSGGRPAADGRGGVDRPGHGRRSPTQYRHPDDHHAAALHRAGARRRHRPALRGEADIMSTQRHTRPASPLTRIGCGVSAAADADARRWCARRGSRPTC